MRFYLALMAVLLLAGCTKEYGPQRLDFVNTSRFTSSNRVGLSPADTLATRIYAENNADGGPRLGRLVITVRYQPRRNPFLYPTPVNSFSRDSIDKSAENFVFLDSTLSRFSGNPPRATGAAPDSFLLTSTYGVRTTTGLERWTYDLYNSSNQPTASRTIQLNMRRPNSLNTYHDYTLKLVIPAVGVPAGPNGLGRSNSTRRFLSLLPGLALPAYTVVRATTPDTAQLRAQRLIDLIVLSDGLTIVTPDAANLNATRWPAKYRRTTRIYPTGLNSNGFSSLVTDAGIANIYTSASTASGAGSGLTTGAVKAGTVYAFRTNEVTTSTATPNYRYGLLLVVSIPSATSTTATAGLQLQVRMAKL